MTGEADLSSRLRALVFHAEQWDQPAELDAQVFGCV